MKTSLLLRRECLPVFRHGDDVARIVRIFNERDLTITDADARDAWGEHSDDVDASWLVMGDDDEAIFTALRHRFDFNLVSPLPDDLESMRGRYERRLDLIAAERDAAEKERDEAKAKAKALREWLDDAAARAIHYEGHATCEDPDTGNECIDVAETIDALGQRGDDEAARADDAEKQVAAIRTAWLGVNDPKGTPEDFDRHNAALDRLLGVDTSNDEPLPLGEKLEALDGALNALEAALRESGCDGDLCTHKWHEDARTALAAGGRR